MTNSCDYAPLFDVKILQLHDHRHRVKIFKHSTVMDTYLNVDEVYAKTPTSVINIGLLCPSTSSASPFATGYIPTMYMRITTAQHK